MKNPRLIVTSNKEKTQILGERERDLSKSLFQSLKKRYYREEIIGLSQNMLCFILQGFVLSYKKKINKNYAAHNYKQRYE